MLLETLFRFNLISPEKLISMLPTNRYTARGGSVVTDIEFNLTYDISTDIGRLLFLNRSFENEEITFISELLAKRGSCTVIDVGANIGWHTISWAKACPLINLCAFEPSRNTVKYLKENIALNGVSKQVSVFEQAVSEECGMQYFYDCSDNAYSSLKDTKRKAVKERYEVKVTTIDDFVASSGITNLQFIKIDVEGFETEVLKGALKTLSGLKPDLFVEIYQGANSNEDPAKTISMLTDLGYKAYIFHKGQLLPFRSHNDKLYNYFFTCKRPY